MKRIVIALMIVLSLSVAAFAEDIALPAPEKSGGMPVLDAIANRKSATDFTDTELSLQQLSNLLWAAGGVNREDSGKLTYASALNMQDIVIYAFTREAVYRYNPKAHTLTLIAEGDKRDLTGGSMQAFVSRAAVDLLYVQDAAKWSGMKMPIKREDILNCGFAHVGSITQSVYLYAASAGLGARTRMGMDREGLTKLLGLGENENLILMQCVGPEK